MQLVWDVTCVDLDPSRIENGCCQPGHSHWDAEESKKAKYVCLTDKGYIFQPLAFEIQVLLLLLLFVDVDSQLSLMGLLPNSF